MSLPTSLEQLRGKRLLTGPAKHALGEIVTEAGTYDDQTYDGGNSRIDYAAYGAAKAAWRAAHPDASNTEDDQAMYAIAFTYGV